MTTLTNTELCNRVRFGVLMKALNLRRADAQNPGGDDGYWLKRWMAERRITVEELDAHERDVDANGPRGLYLIPKPAPSAPLEVP